MTNVLLYWNDITPPDSVSSVVGEWLSAVPDWDVRLLNWEESLDFIRETFGKDTAKLFAKYKIPA